MIHDTLKVRVSSRWENFHRCQLANDGAEYIVVELSLPVVADRCTQTHSPLKTEVVSFSALSLAFKVRKPTKALNNRYTGVIPIKEQSEKLEKSPPPTMSGLNSNIAHANAAWDQLDRMLAHEIHPSASPVMHIALYAMAGIAPLTGLLFLVGGLKRISKGGQDSLWLFRVDDRGYIHPNAIFVVTIWACLFTALDTAALVCLLLNLSTFVKWYTLVLHVMSFPVIFCFGWTKVWCFSYAAPPSALCLDSKRASSPTHHRKMVGPWLFNVGNITMYMIPFAFTIPLAISIAKKLRDVELYFNKYQEAHQLLKSILTTPGISEISPSAKQLQVKILLELNTLSKLSKEILFIVRCIAGGYAILDLIFTIGAIWTTWRIMRTLWSQVATLRRCAQRRRGDCSAIRPTNSKLSRHDIDQDNASTCPMRAISSYSIPSISSNGNLLPWMPPFARGTEITRSTWTSGACHDKREDWEKYDEFVLSQKYACLSRYASNALWQATLIVVTSALFMTLDIFIVTNAMGVPHRHRLSDLTMVVIVWGNVIWNCGLGTILGIMSCVVAFSPTPQALAEEITLDRYEGKAECLS
ncbi:uncharacterized protein MELLADRAFT_88580 [Melampsora larici-populina 98AG31]|uniref:Uncharacterized protein n=1 Tax=Melampsora larici-populina (strain 98AG31 / pathotype 3-4-7) TaxID=747676 RepID=F4RS95_MELLP|nr:uncharacterized protein MELLADRAFT_88580 [Melampsora larici-populina 98AG31]EGG04816.1 hypothetical protein MELLADRAFT_88580 [Melampsora larici-populina 98AG31]